MCNGIRSGFGWTATLALTLGLLPSVRATGSGDMNCDGLVDNLDIDPFVLALSDPPTYQQTYPACFLDNADVNLDGMVDFGDVLPFCNLLSPSQANVACGTGPTFNPGASSLRVFFSLTDQTAGTPQELLNQQNAVLDTSAGTARAYLWAQAQPAGDEWDGLGIGIHATGSVQITNLTLYNPTFGLPPRGRWDCVHTVSPGATQFEAFNLVAVLDRGVQNPVPSDGYVDTASDSVLLGFVEFTGVGDVFLGVADMGIVRQSGTPSSDAVYFGFGDIPITGDDIGACTALADLTCATITGACCFASGSCLQSTQTVCTQGGGLYLGDGAPCACAASNNLGQGQTTPMLDPTGGSGDPTQDVLVTVTNVSGSNGANVIVGEVSGNPYPGAGGYGALGHTVLVHTTLSNGQFFMTVQVPFAQADLPTPTTDPLTITLSYYDPISGNWVLAVAGDIGDSTGKPPGQKIGDLFQVTGPPVPALSTDLGNYGVYWDASPNVLRGFAWANVDHATGFAPATPPVTGACCFADGSCQDLTATDCANQNATYQGDGSTCSPTNPCPQPITGACCFADGSCQDLTATDCATQSGNYQGDGTTCAPNTCIGACCLGAPSYGCTDGSPADCQTNGGAYRGNGTTCSSVACHLGDMNCDGLLDDFDIDPFVFALISRSTYESAYPNCNFFNADVNQDGQVDFADDIPFAALLVPSQTDPNCGSGSASGTSSLRLFFSLTDQTGGTPLELLNQQNAVLDTTAGPTWVYLWAQATGPGNPAWDGLGVGIHASGGVQITDLYMVNPYWIDGDLYRWDYVHAATPPAPTSFAAINLVAVTTYGVRKHEPLDGFTDPNGTSVFLGAVQLTGQGDVFLGVDDMGISRAGGSRNEPVYFGFNDGAVPGGNFGVCSTLADLSCAAAATGACCFANGTCQLLTLNDCASQSGTYQGNGTTCADCPPPCPLVCPPDKQLQCGASTDPASTGAPTGCDAPCSATYTDAPAVGCTGADIDRTWTCTNSVGVQTSCVQHITFVDPPPQITCPSNLQVPHDPGQCCAVVTFTVIATDICDPSPTVVCHDQRGRVVHSGDCFPVGTTSVTCTATNRCGNTATCAFHVTVFGSICGLAFYDANANGQNDGEAPIPGLKIELLDGQMRVIERTTTSLNGSFCFADVLPGFYYVREGLSSLKGRWMNTTPPTLGATISGMNVGCSPTVNFGAYQYCSPANGSPTTFWTSASGQTVLRQVDPAWRMALNQYSLTNVNGGLYRVPVGVNFNVAYASFLNWLISVNGTLSGEFAVTVLNTQFQHVSSQYGIIVPGAAKGDAAAFCIVPFLSVPQAITCGHTPLLTLTVFRTQGTCGCASRDGFVTISDLISRAACVLSSYGNPQNLGIPFTYAQCLEDLLETINNNGNFGLPCGQVMQYVLPAPDPNACR